MWDMKQKAADEQTNSQSQTTVGWLLEKGGGRMKKLQGVEYILVEGD